MTEIFRRAREDEIPAIARLVAHSFVARSAESHEETLSDGAWGGFETLWVGEEGGRLIAACQLLPLRQWIGGVSFPMMGLGTVAVAPTHRRRGLAARLVTSALHEARSRGNLVSALYPFRVAFYQRLGYGCAGEAHQYRVAPETIPDYPERFGISLAESDLDREAMRELYERWARTQSGQLARTLRSWERLLLPSDRAGVIYRNDGGRPEGYAIVRYRTDLSERFLEVHERVWLSEGARRGIYGWLASLGDQWRQLLYRAHVDERFGDLLREPRLASTAEPGWGLWFPAATVVRGPMFRIVDLPGVFAARERFGDASLSVVLEVEDAQLQENAGRWRLRLESGSPTIERAVSRGGDATLATSIDVLSQVFIGAVRPSEAVAIGMARLSDSQILPALDTAFSLPRPWTFDGF